MSFKKKNSNKIVPNHTRAPVWIYVQSHVPLNLFKTRALFFSHVPFIILTARAPGSCPDSTHSHLPSCHLPVREQGADSHTQRHAQTWCPVRPSSQPLPYARSTTSSTTLTLTHQEDMRSSLYQLHMQSYIRRIHHGFKCCPACRFCTNIFPDIIIIATVQASRANLRAALCNGVAIRSNVHFKRHCAPVGQFQLY